MKFTEQIFLEAIKLSKARKYVKDWDKDRLKDWFGGKYRVYIDLEKGKAASEDLESELEQEVKKSLHNTDFEVKDFKKGMAFDKKNKREVKLGKVLSKIDKNLLQKFANDPNREASKISEPIVVISRHPYDIAGQSSDRGWTSCKDLSGGENKRYIKAETGLALIAYLIYKDDKNINKPIARILISQFSNKEKDIVYVPQFITYGSAGVWERAFKDTIQKWLDEKQGKKSGHLKLTPKQYPDALGNKIYIPDENELPKWIVASGNRPLSFSFAEKRPDEFHWKGGTWYEGVWKDGVFENGLWEDGVWEDGRWAGGTWRKGTWQKGTFEDGNWRGGTWENGTWDGGKWWEGTWKDGTWRRGFWYNGTWESGVWKAGNWGDGTWEKGIWEKGIWEKGEWRDGTWRDGVWFDGTWEGGEWKTGLIYDPHKQGNFKDDWKWEGHPHENPKFRKEHYVRSPINPKEYFKGKGNN